ncbi:MAG: hypothetical protein ABS68_01280 [Niastella sp. SCN 39-18]|nr:hypothetical protein [Sphingobacteriales bacterium]ODT54439.1 MAG: hypothetical protein ABS68_01280 [Niastella sp. SCN 39-18]OJW10708.1 MAG: hypothetical protein BGO53_14050 [Sphingobacteriales bacterium 39-19]
MKKIICLCLIAFCAGKTVSAQIDLNKIDLNKIDISQININQILGKVLKVDKGFAPKFSLGKQPIEKIFKVAEIIGLKKNDKANKLFNTFRTGRTIYKVAAYTGAAITTYATIRAVSKAAKTDYQTALAAGLSSIGSGLIVKFLTKGASYKAVDIFNGVVTKSIKDILSVGPASQTVGVGLYVKL